MQSELYDDVFLCKISWSKNVNTERDAPEQIVLGANDPYYCAVLGLAVNIEYHTTQTNNQHVFQFGKGVCGTKTKIANTLKHKVIHNPKFEAQSAGKLSTHSIRKMSATCARSSGVQKDDIDTRGRWRQNRQSDTYVATTVPYPDAKVASVLAMGGPIKYIPKHPDDVTDAWILANVAQVARTKVPPKVAAILGKALCWAAFDPIVQRYFQTG